MQMPSFSNPLNCLLRTNDDLDFMIILIIEMLVVLIDNTMTYSQVKVENKI